MGVGYQGLQFALMAKRHKVNFERTITIGRQNHFLDTATLRSMFARFGLPLSEAEEVEILKEPYSEALFKQLGANAVDSMDASDYEGANIIHDLNVPIDASLARRYSCVIDFGSIEHVFNFPVALKNASDLIEVGGHLVSLVTANNFMGHGFYQFSPELFYSYLPRNGFADLGIYLALYRGFPYFFRISDPNKLRGRVELVNSEPVMLGIIARKVEHLSHVTFPIQSDYLQEFWYGRDVNRECQLAPVDLRLASALGDFRTRLASLIGWPETISPHFVQGFDNALHYQLIDPATDSAVGDAAALVVPGGHNQSLVRVRTIARRYLAIAARTALSSVRRGIRTIVRQLPRTAAGRFGRDRVSPGGQRSTAVAMPPRRDAS